MALDQAQPTEPRNDGPAMVGVGSMAALGAITGLGALAASSCCVLPIVLGGLGSGAGIFTVLGVLAPFRIPLMATSVLAVVIGWFLYAPRQQQVACGPDGSCAAPRRSPTALVLLTLATILIVTAAVGGYFEAALIKILRSIR